MDINSGHSTVNALNSSNTPFLWFAFFLSEMYIATLFLGPTFLTILYSLNSGHSSNFSFACKWPLHLAHQQVASYEELAQVNVRPLAFHI